LSAGIPFAHFNNVEAGMCDIAPATTGYSYFGKKFACFFEEDHLQRRIHPCCIHCAEKSGSAATDYYKAATCPPIGECPLSPEGGT
jgi:hypothetical protein